MRRCGMEGRRSRAPPSPEDEADALYLARHACRAYCAGADAAPDLALTTAEVHDYPSSESGIATDCAHVHRPPRRARAPSDDDDDDDEILPASLAALRLREAPSRWNRDNIAATMERFEPADYCYAYYEAGPAMRHNMSMPSSSRKAGRQRARAPAGQTAPRERTTRHAYVTRYGTEENIYEEIAEGSRCPKHRYALRQSLVSLDQSVVEEEVRRVESRHKRILGELNLSVEAMLMPECESPDSERGEDRDNIEDLLRVGPTDELLSPAGYQPPDLDSGFSGSSSGASYVGSLRKAPGASPHLPAVAYGSRAGAGGGVRILSAGDAGGRCARRTGAGAGEAHATRSSSCGDKSNNFWNKKSWRRLPGFSSSTSIHKAGLTGLLVRYTFRRKSAPAPPGTTAAPATPACQKARPEPVACEACLSQRC